MNKEICYPLSQHLQLLNLLFLTSSKTVDGTPNGDPIIQSSENEIGPYSMAMQNYSNPTQSLNLKFRDIPKGCYRDPHRDQWKPQDPAMAEITPKMDRLMNSFVVTLSDKANVSPVQA